MATLRQDLLRSTFQEKQINLLKSLDSNMSKSTKAVIDTNDFLEDKFFNKLDTAFRDLAKAINTKADYYIDPSRAVRDTAREARRREDARHRYTERREDDRHRDAERREDDRHRDSERSLRRIEAAREKAIDRITDSLGSLAKEIGLNISSVIDNSNEFTAFYNTILKNTGMSGESVQALRSDILGTVKDLNDQYRNAFGGIFNATEALQVMATIVNAGVRNPEYYEEFGDELLEANAVMNINLATLAEFSDKFYRRYNFSSENMESLLNNINENVSVTGVSEEKLLEQIKENEFLTNQWLTRREGLERGSDEFLARQEEINLALNDTLTYATEVGLENTLSTIFSALDKGADSKEAIDLLAATGMNYETLLRGYMTDPMELLYEVSERIRSHPQTNRFGYMGFQDTLGGATFGKELMEEVILATQMTPEEFEALKAERATAESLSDKLDAIFVSPEDRMANELLDTYGDSLATFQENSGIGLGFLETISQTVIGILGLLMTYTGSRTLSSLLNSESGLSGYLGRLFGGSSGAGSRGLLAVGSKAGVAAIAVAAVAATVKAIGDVKDEISRVRDNSDERESDLIPEITPGKHYGLETYTELDEAGNIIDKVRVVEVDEPVTLSEEEVREQIKSAMSSYLYEDYYGKALLDGYYHPADLGPMITNLFYDEALSGYVPMTTDSDFFGYITPKNSESYDEVFRRTVDNYINEHLDDAVESYYGGSTDFTAEGFWSSRTWMSRGIANTTANSAYQSVLGVNSLDQVSDEAALLYQVYSKLGILDDMSMEYLLNRFIPNQDKLIELTQKGYFLGSSTFESDTLSNLSVDELISRGMAREITSLDPESSSYEALSLLSDTLSDEDTPEYAVGTNYVPYDQLAYIHEGEAITPKQYNPAANVNELERLRSHEADVQKSTLSSMREIVSTMSAIKEFLEYWRQDNIDREVLANMKATTSSANKNLLSIQSGYSGY